jgi:hypothetical protein
MLSVMMQTAAKQYFFRCHACFVSGLIRTCLELAGATYGKNAKQWTPLIQRTTLTRDTNTVKLYHMSGCSVSDGAVCEKKSKYRFPPTCSGDIGQAPQVQLGDQELATARNA